jgi:hypothetical protein
LQYGRIGESPPLSPESTEDLLEAVIGDAWMKTEEQGFSPPLVMKAVDSVGEVILYMIWDVDSEGLPLAREDGDTYASTTAHFPIFVTVTDRNGESFTLRVEGPKV